MSVLFSCLRKNKRFFARPPPFFTRPHVYAQKKSHPQNAPSARLAPTHSPPYTTPTSIHYPQQPSPYAKIAPLAKKKNGESALSSFAVFFCIIFAYSFSS